MSEPSGPSKVVYETIYSKRLRERIKNTKPPVKVANVTRNRSTPTTPKTPNTNRLQHPYKTVSTQGRITNLTNLGSADTIRRESTQKNFSEKSKEKDDRQMVTNQLILETAKTAAAESSAGSTHTTFDEPHNSKPNNNRARKSLEKAEESKENASNASPHTATDRKSSEKTVKTNRNTDWESKQNALSANLDAVTDRKSSEKADETDLNAELETSENTESKEKTFSGGYSDSTEEQESAESSDSINSSESSHSSLEKSDIIRADESLEKLINDLEGTNEDSNSSKNLNGTVLEMDLDESNEESPKIKKNKPTFSEKKKYGEKFKEFESAYKTLEMPKHVTARFLDCGQDPLLSDGSTITPGATPPSGNENRPQYLNPGPQQKFNKDYSNIVEDKVRLEVFEENFKIIEEHNARYRAGLETYYMGINQFADLTSEEFSEKLKLQIRTGAIEGQYAIRKNQKIALSEQQLLDCSVSYGTGNCQEGGAMVLAFKYVKDHGLQTESAYPYKARQGTCLNQSGPYKVRGYSTIAANENALKNAVGTVGPISVAIYADPIQFYKGGIFQSSTCYNDKEHLDHGVLAVGYGTAPSDYWIIKNSWGVTWGEQGYFRLARNGNQCGIALDASYPTL
ncbi:unnamed protein product [Psylliodes chrysocephalus]|uniref:Uncharacterized protein n=1 Tax=Psylliodes chrysocephalus TaxID=3402493 RepID=A0A9P0GG58_9CUCU|nr:unnamed protein product [Psylliodes chrysocephala]